ncbi:MBL fold metallo-hydrolase [Mycolicibacterium mageritense]|uniref:Metallo-beta-lactamase domain-containing protein n=1 Tax=Mycolicibacterium mageritense TaxID=53462 RepID=A0AAI8TZG4_MYCME|nr:MBL fold metallo-hydrolase [Mycolicibacterium mageritense]BDY31859.1 hypothetical protein hbim_05817 [Mycolicibacterium mageritense]GJJ18392.1 MBL fold metallo-hydrolase [Mycolicibacterium mageritense]
MNYRWETLADGVWRTRLPFLDVTVGVVRGRDGALLVDSGTTETEARAIEQDVRLLAGQGVEQIVLTHNHFDHVLGSAWFRDAGLYCAPEVAATMTTGTDRLRADALDHGADPVAVDRAIAALRRPDHLVHRAEVELGERHVTIVHPGPGHTDHDLIVVVAGAQPVVFCGDLVEESGDPVIDSDSDIGAWPGTLDRVIAAGGAHAAYVPGHGATVGVDFVRRQRSWLAQRV